VVSLSPAMVRLITEQVAERLVIGDAETLPASWSFRARRHGQTCSTHVVPRTACTRCFDLKRWEFAGVPMRCAA
jgi:hypothetical protein